MAEIDIAFSEALLIITAIDSDNIGILQEKGISPDDMSFWGEVLKFVFDHNLKYGKAPEVDTIKALFTEFPSENYGTCDFDFLIDTVRENGRKKKIRKVISEAIDLNEEDSGKAASFIIAQIGDLEKYTKTRASFLDGGANEKLERYLKKRDRLETGHRIGLPTGISKLDEQLIGWAKGDLALVAGPPEVGKSWILLKMCSVSYVEGARILYISPEMMEEDVTFRLHSILAREYGFSFSNEALMSGSLKNIKDYEEFLKRVEKRKDWMIVDEIEGGQFTVSKIEGLIKAFKPDIVAIDSIILLTASDGTPAISWQSLIDVAYGLKMMSSRTGVVTIVTAPSSTETFDTFEPAYISEIGLSRNIGYALDIGISISETNDALTRAARIFKKRKGRKIINKFYIPFNPDIGVIG